MIKIHFVGDFFPGGVILDQERICSDEVLTLLKDADIRVATLETAVGDDYPFDEEKMSNPSWRNIIYTPNRGLKHLEKLNINVVTLANNHIFDMGEEGLINTIKRLDSLGIKHCGAGRNIKEASAPAVVKVKGKTIAFISAMPPTWGAAHPASETKAGINMLYHDKIAENIKDAKTQYDYVFVLPHWGVEYTYWPVPGDIKIAKLLIDSGADGVFGSHTHQVQTYRRYSNKPIFFSLGNFIFPDFYMDILRPVCYPVDNLDNIPISYNYEKNLKKIVKRVWKDKNRIGMLTSVLIDEGNIDYKVQYTKLNKNNKLECYSDTWLTLKLKTISCISSLTVYLYGYIVMKKLHGLLK